MIKSAEQLLCIQKQKKQTDFGDSNKMFKLEKVEPNSLNQKNIKIVEKEKERDKDIIPLKNTMKKNI